MATANQMMPPKRPSDVAKLESSGDATTHLKTYSGVPAVRQRPMSWDRTDPIASSA
jgi:hypothetical protein